MVMRNMTDKNEKNDDSVQMEAMAEEEAEKSFVGETQTFRIPSRVECESVEPKDVEMITGSSHKQPESPSLFAPPGFEKTEGTNECEVDIDVMRVVSTKSNMKGGRKSIRKIGLRLKENLVEASRRRPEKNWNKNRNQTMR
ncbi:hypothetical protein PIB30_011415 [Stylosanthes scabra]|uniref:Uncharacterized protein n=1 Tax=Stylosanthes scabra TaxID=79078 RepID=A0ABU6Z3K2_9FABA|nr:hypothetical protein [Stylosanthes scabra]